MSDCSPKGGMSDTEVNIPLQSGLDMKAKRENCDLLLNLSDVRLAINLFVRPMYYEWRLTSIPADFFYHHLECHRENNV